MNISIKTWASVIISLLRLEFWVKFGSRFAIPCNAQLTIDVIDDDGLLVTSTCDNPAPPIHRHCYDTLCFFLIFAFHIPIIYFLATALARSARASRRLNLASSMTPASASLEKFPLQVTKVAPSCFPEVMG